MSSKIQFPLLLLATVLAGLLAGFFYTWSFTVMQSLNLIDANNAAAAMISINANIRSAWFGAIFFGAPITILISLLMMLSTENKRMKWCVSLALLFAVATLVITFTRHLPLNSELADGASWSSYYAPWIEWNHARMATSLLAFISMLCAVTMHSKLK